LNNELRIENPTSADDGIYTLEADYTNIYGNTTDSLIQMFFPEGSDTVDSHVTFEIANVTFDPGCFAGSDDLNRSDVKIYPNPTTGLTKISGLNENADLKLINSVGQIVLESKVDSEHADLDLSTLIGGIYVVLLEFQKGTATTKLHLLR